MNTLMWFTFELIQILVWEISCHYANSVVRKIYNYSLEIGMGCCVFRNNLQFAECFILWLLNHNSIVS
jgi:hypothetical protein